MASQLLQLPTSDIRQSCSLFGKYISPNDTLHIYIVHTASLAGVFFLLLLPLIISLQPRHRRKRFASFAVRHIFIRILVWPFAPLILAVSLIPQGMFLHTGLTCSHPDFAKNPFPLKPWQGWSIFATEAVIVLFAAWKLAKGVRRALEKERQRRAGVLHYGAMGPHGRTRRRAMANFAEPEPTLVVPRPEHVDANTAHTLQNGDEIRPRKSTSSIPTTTSDRSSRPGLIFLENTDTEYLLRRSAHKLAKGCRRDLRYGEVLHNGGPHAREYDWPIASQESIDRSRGTHNAGPWEFPKDKPYVSQKTTKQTSARTSRTVTPKDSQQLTSTELTTLGAPQQLTYTELPIAENGEGSSRDAERLGAQTQSLAADIEGYPLPRMPPPSQPPSQPRCHSRAGAIGPDGDYIALAPSPFESRPGGLPMARLSRLRNGPYTPARPSPLRTDTGLHPGNEDPQIAVPGNEDTQITVHGNEDAQITVHGNEDAQITVPGASFLDRCRGKAREKLHFRIPTRRKLKNIAPAPQDTVLEVPASENRMQSLSRTSTVSLDISLEPLHRCPRRPSEYSLAAFSDDSGIELQERV